MRDQRRHGGRQLRSKGRSRHLGRRSYGDADLPGHVHLQHVTASQGPRRHQQPHRAGPGAGQPLPYNERRALHACTGPQRGRRLRQPGQRRPGPRRFGQQPEAFPQCQESPVPLRLRHPHHRAGNQQLRRLGLCCQHGLRHVRQGRFAHGPRGLHGLAQLDPRDRPQHGRPARHRAKLQRRPGIGRPFRTLCGQLLHPSRRRLLRQHHELRRAPHRQFLRHQRLHRGDASWRGRPPQRGQDLEEDQEVRRQLYRQAQTLPHLRGGELQLQAGRFPYVAGRRQRLVGALVDLLQQSFPNNRRPLLSRTPLQRQRGLLRHLDQQRHL